MGKFRPAPILAIPTAKIDCAFYTSHWLTFDPIDVTILEVILVQKVVNHHGAASREPRFRDKS